MSEDFSVRDRIRALLDETELIGPVEIAAKLIADMSRDERALAFEQTAELVVSVYLTRDRMHAVATPTSGRPSQTKAQRVAEWWRAELRKQYRGVEGWLMLADFGPDDHVFAAEERRHRAAAITANADWHERCAEAMRKAGVDKFAALPPDVLVELLKTRRPE